MSSDCLLRSQKTVVSSAVNLFYFHVPGISAPTRNDIKAAVKRWIVGLHEFQDLAMCRDTRG